MTRLMMRASVPGLPQTTRTVDTSILVDIAGTPRNSCSTIENWSAGLKVGSHFLTMVVPHKSLPIRSPTSKYDINTFLSNIHSDAIEYDSKNLVTPEGEKVPLCPIQSKSPYFFEQNNPVKYFVLQHILCYPAKLIGINRGHRLASHHVGADSAITNCCRSNEKRRSREALSLCRWHDDTCQRNSHESNEVEDGCKELVYTRMERIGNEFLKNDLFATHQRPPGWSCRTQRARKRHTGRHREDLSQSQRTFHRRCRYRHLWRAEKW